MNYQISSGMGPAECELGVAKLLAYLEQKYEIRVLKKTPGCKKNIYRSVFFSCEECLSDYIGTIQWVCQSPYRPTHKRKNWYIDFQVCPSSEVMDFDPTQIVFQTFRSSGKGGQNVNKVETGVRAIYTPAGLTAECTEERSQYLNKQKAVARLKAQSEQMGRDRKAKECNENWRLHTRIKRGNACIIFKGLQFLHE